MGWWSETILGGDTPLDYLSMLGDELGLVGYTDDESTEESLYPLNALRDNKRVSKKVYGAFKKFDPFKWMRSNESRYIDESDRAIQAQVIAVSMMAVGFPFSSNMKELALKSATDPDLDNWASPERRQVVLDDYRKTVENYDNKTPTFITEEGLFDKMAEALWY